jgi:hypothetical protein
MSFPTIISTPSVSTDSNNSTHIQVATEFSYTFSNSGLVVPGFFTYPPKYTAAPGINIGFLTFSPYSSNSTLAQVNSPNAYINFSGDNIYYDDDVATGATFKFEIPYPPNYDAFGFISLGYSFLISSTIVDGSRIRTISVPGVGTIPYVQGNEIELVKRTGNRFYDLKFPAFTQDCVITDAVGSGTYITYTTDPDHGRSIGDTVTITGLVGYAKANVVNGVVASIPDTYIFTINIADAGTTTITDQEGVLKVTSTIIEANGFNFSADLVWTDPGLLEYVPTKLYVLNNEVTFGGTREAPNAFRVKAADNAYYSPSDRQNFGYWWPVSGALVVWDSTTTYFIGTRVAYNNEIYQSLVVDNLNNIPPESGEDSYWIRSNINYPIFNQDFTFPQGTIVVDQVTKLTYQAVLIYNANSINVPGRIEDNVYWTPIAYTPPAPSTTEFTLTSPDRFVYYPAVFPTLTLSGQTSNALLPFLSGNVSELITFSSGGGFQSVPTSGQPLKLTIVQSVLGVAIASSNFFITVDPFTISIDPPFITPLSLVTYQPFGTYTYTIPDNLVNVALQYDTTATSALLVPYIVSGESQYSLTFGSTTGLTTTGNTTIKINAVLNGIDTLATTIANLVTSATSITITPSIPTGSLSLFKYESFSYAFTTNLNTVGLSFRASRSSTEVIPFVTISEDLQTVIFEGSFQIGYTNTLSLVVDLLFGSTIIDTKTILMTVGQGRFFPPTANQNFQLYQYENVVNTFGSNPDFLTGLPITTILSIPSLPSGLTFGGSCNTFFLQGTPLLQVNQSNYQVIGSNSSNGKIVTTTISIRVNPQQVIITPNTSTLSGLIVDTPITPITLTAIQPDTIYANTFRYTWTGLPDGFAFQDINGSNVSQPFAPQDAALTIILSGAPSLAFANTLSTYSSNLYQTRLTGTQTDQTTKQTIGTSLINFSLGETVLIDVSNSVTLYKSKPLGSEDVLITARSYFPNSTVLTPTFDALPPGLSLVSTSLNYVWRLTGTPTEVNLIGSYTFTATNANGVTRSVVAIIPVNPNIVTFGGSSPANGSVIRFIVSRPLTNEKSGYYSTPIIFSATSTANATPITYSSSIDFSIYGLALNSSSGTLTGIPTSPLSSTTVTISATDNLGTIGTTTIQLSILADTFSWSSYTPTYFQNRAITPFQFLATSTLSERLIQSYSSTNLPTGLRISAGGLLTGTPSTGTSGSFTIAATTGYSETNQVYSYSIIGDQLMIVQTNGSDIIQTTFSGIEYRAIQYSSDSFVNAVFSIDELSPITSATISVTSSGLVSGNFTGADLNTTYSANLTAVYEGVTTTTPIYVSFTSFAGSGTGSIRIPTELSTLTFSQPTQTTFTFFEYVPYLIQIQAIGSASFIYYYTSAIPLGFEFMKDSIGLTASLSGISPTIANQGIIIYAKTANGYPISTSITIRTITPFFVNPQIGAAAYTALLRNDVLGNAAQNARDNRVFPEVNPLAGPLMAPRAPDVVTPNDCILKLCKKPCPTCRTMM